MLDLFGTNQGKDPFRLGKQVSGRRTMAVQSAVSSFPDEHEPLYSLRGDKKDPSVQVFPLYRRNASCLVSGLQHWLSMTG